MIRSYLVPFLMLTFKSVPAPLIITASEAEWQEWERNL